MADDERVESAVTLPFRRDRHGELRLVLIERTRHGRHGGQVALPGGRREAVDATPRDTAVRETCEELGIEPGRLTVLAGLDAVETRTTGFTVWPFVARLDTPGGLAATVHAQEREVAQVIDLPVAELADPARVTDEDMRFPGWDQPRRTRVVRLRGHVLWGLTLRVIEPVLPRALAGEYGL